MRLVKIKDLQAGDEVIFRLHPDFPSSVDRVVDVYPEDDKQTRVTYASFDRGFIIRSNDTDVVLVSRQWQGNETELVYSLRTQLRQAAEAAYGFTNGSKGVVRNREILVPVLQGMRDLLDAYLMGLPDKSKPK